ncbi:MAG: hypothetical protein GYA24_24355 [Candidatus Lokiarchaeota archaeon]|nr:hypothetical protein [Candidatus Lokiarchaeota archaeon]
MERRSNEPASGMQCPECGLAIKVTSQPLEKCPVCGAKLPMLTDAKKGVPERKGPISLEQALFKSPRVKESWVPREMFGAFILAYFVTYAANYLIIASGMVSNPDGTLKFDAAGFFLLNVVGMLAGITPLVYVLANKTSVRKLSITSLGAPGWRAAILIGIGFGIVLFLAQFLGTAINRASGISALLENPANDAYNAFIRASTGNRLVMLLPIAAAQVLGEFLYRGVILNGLLQWLRKRVPPVAPATMKVGAWGLSILLGTLFDLSIFFNPASIVPSLFIHAIIGLLYIVNGNLQSCMIAQATCMVLEIALL